MSPVLDVHGLIVAEEFYTLKDMDYLSFSTKTLEVVVIKLKNFNINKQKEIDRALCLCCRVIQFIYPSV